MAQLKLKEYDPYAGGRLNTYSTGEQELIARTYERPTPPKFKVHTVTEGETLSYIAWLYYNGVDQDPSKWLHLIALDNGIEKQWDLSDFVGKEIRIPDLIQFKLSRRTIRTIRQNIARSSVQLNQN